jgi:hypothetical protein
MNNQIKIYVERSCSPQAEMISFISDEYNFLKHKVLLGRTFQSGSYGRGTAIREVNDLDVIWVIPSDIRKSVDVAQIEITDILKSTAEEIRKAYLLAGKNVKVEPREHSVLIEYPNRNDEFSIDIVPAQELSELNKFGDKYLEIPEVGLLKRSQRAHFYKTHESVKWIKTDPKGYKSQAKHAEEKFEIFKEVVKIVKSWKHIWKLKLKEKQNFKLKSFHLEQIVYQVLTENSTENGLDLLMKVFDLLPQFLEKPQIQDRAQDGGPVRFIDCYLNELTEEQKKSVLFARDNAIALFKSLQGDSFDVEEFLKRLLSPEEMISAYGFNFTGAVQDKNHFYVDGRVEPKKGLLCGSLRFSPLLQQGLTKGSSSRDIFFEAKNTTSLSGVEYWKVRNTGDEAFNAKCLRGEITRLSTQWCPETTAYSGNHQVTCYLVDESSMRVLTYDTIIVRIK